MSKYSKLSPEQKTKEKAYQMIKIQCPRCGCESLRCHLSRHQKSKKCKMATELKALKEQPQTV